MLKIRDVLALAPVIPVLTVEKLEHAAPLATALYAGGLKVLEITLRTHAALAVIEAMLDALMRSEGEPDLVQFSGGEPTLHPEFFEILAAAKRRPIRHLMINTNGLTIAREAGFAERLAEFMPG